MRNSVRANFQSWRFTAVGAGELRGTGYPAYGIFIIPGRIPRDTDEFGHPTEVTLDEIVSCDLHQLEGAICDYARTGAKRGSKGTGGGGRRNVGLGGPCFKPSQNSNTMIKYVLRQSGVNHPAPDRAVGWDTEPTFPYSTDVDMPDYDCNW